MTEEEAILDRLEEHDDAWAFRKMKDGYELRRFDARNPPRTKYKYVDGQVFLWTVEKQAWLFLCTEDAWSLRTTPFRYEVLK